MSNKTSKIKENRRPGPRQSVGWFLVGIILGMALDCRWVGAEPAVCRLTPFHTGVCQLGEDHVLGEGHDVKKRLTFVVYSFLVEGPRGGRALVDLGPQTLPYCNDMFRRYGFFRDWGPTVPAEKRFPDDIVQPYGNVFAQLAKRNVPIASIKHIVFSHLHAGRHTHA